MTDEQIIEDLAHTGLIKDMSFTITRPVWLPNNVTITRCRFRVLINFVVFRFEEEPTNIVFTHNHIFTPWGVDRDLKELKIL